jgi:predicted RNase H-related nuclease YkuK (DUF458 family)
MALTENKLEQVKAFLATAPAGSDVYIGCDSTRFKNNQGLWTASYTTVVVVAIMDDSTGRRAGCRVFACTDQQQDYDQKKNRPMLRMMNEAYRTAEAYQQLEEDLLEHEVELHLDINKSPMHGSNVAHNAAVGYLTGISGRPVKTKPDAWAATHVADHGVRGKFDAYVMQ